MKTYFSIAWIALCFSMFFISCLEDEGNYNYIDPGTFYVDTLGKQHVFTVKQYNTFYAPSNLVYDGDKSKLKYKWELYKSENTSIGGSSYGTGFSHDYTRDDYPDYTISHEEQLAAQITAMPGSYYLVFTATDTTTGLKAMMDYRLTVEGKIGSGLAVLYKNANGIDIDVVASPLFDGALTEESYIRNAYTSVNAARPFTGEPRELVSAISAGSGLYYVYLTSTEDAVRLSSIDMSVADEFGQIFAGKVPAVKALSHIWINSDLHFFVNNGVAYKCNYESPLVTPLAMGDFTYRAVATGGNTYGGNSLWYDAEQRRFLFSQMWSAEIAPINNKAEHFDFGNVGKDILYWSKGYYQGNTYTNYCFFKNPTDDGKRWLYVFLSDDSSPAAYPSKCAMDLSNCPDVASALSFATGERGPVVFYTTATKVYRMTYNVDEGSASATDVWPSPAGETITRIELCKSAGQNMENSNLDKYLLIATYNKTSGKGKIYVMASDIASGVLESEPLTTLEFDGQIADFDFI